jgi:hypothetical protein
VSLRLVAKPPELFRARGQYPFRVLSMLLTLRGESLVQPPMRLRRIFKGVAVEWANDWFSAAPRRAAVSLVR